MSKKDKESRSSFDLREALSFNEYLGKNMFVKRICTNVEF